MRPRTCLALLVAVIALTACPATSSATTTIGVPTPAGGGLTNTGSCAGSQKCTYLPVAGISPAYVSPVDGTIVRWRIAADSSGSPVQLRVLRPAAGGQFTAVGTSAPQTTTGLSKVDTFTTSLTIRAGDAIGLDNGSDALMWRKAVTGQGFRFHTPFLADGTTAAFNPSNAGDNGLQLQINADIEPSPNQGAPAVVAPGTPVISRLRVAPSRLAVGTRARILFTLSAPARYTLTFNRLVPGRRRGTRCVPQSRTVNTGRRCTARLRKGTRRGAGRMGVNRLTFRGRVAGKALAVGRYELVATAVGATGKRAPKATTRFRIVRRRTR